MCKLCTWFLFVLRDVQVYLFTWENRKSYSNKIPIQGHSKDSPRQDMYELQVDLDIFFKNL